MESINDVGRRQRLIDDSGDIATATSLPFASCAYAMKIVNTTKRKRNFDRRFSF